MKKIVIIIYSVFILFSISNGLFAQESKGSFSFDCKTCHECDTPTKSNPCLISCPRHTLITIHHSPEEGPGIVLMDEFKDISDYCDPVYFSHRAHAEMSEISGGCKMCHHYNPPGKIVRCNYCHDRERKREDITKPDLKGAYHRQCLDCHKQWNNQIECVQCHCPEPLPENELKTPVSTGSVKRIHPKIETPARVIYDTKSDEGPVVTFYHNDHTNLFGFGCESCHSNDSCTKCHQKSPEIKVLNKSLEEHHLRCSKCHDIDKSCSECHSKEIKNPFKHSVSTGFALKSYHSKLACTDCHGGELKFSKANKACISCHSGWNQSTFKHSVTGLTLNEIHSEFECTDCHLENKFDTIPSCESCHEDIKFPQSLPGKRNN